MFARKKRTGVRAMTDPAEKKSSVKLGFKRGKETSTYKPTRALTSDPKYGKENPSAPDPKFIQDARKHKQDIVHHDGKAYRAGVTTVSKEKDQHTIDVEIDRTIPKIRPMSQPDPKVAPAEKANHKMASGRRVGKRRLDRVPYLQGKGYGRNKKTEAGYGPK
jgi:hypothetical protein